MVIRKQLVRGRKGLFMLCADDSNGRIYYRKDGHKLWRRFKAPDSPLERLELTLGKRGMFCLVGDASGKGEVYFRRFKRGAAWVRFNGPKHTASGH